MWNFAYPYKLKQLIDLACQRNMLCYGFTPVGGRRGEKKVFLLARPQRGMVCLDRGELTPLVGRLLRGHPSSTVQIDYVLNQNFPTFSGL